MNRGGVCGNGVESLVFDEIGLFVLASRRLRLSGQAKKRLHDPDERECGGESRPDRAAFAHDLAPTVATSVEVLGREVPVDLLAGVAAAKTLFDASPPSLGSVLDRTDHLVQ